MVIKTDRKERVEPRNKRRRVAKEERIKAEKAPRPTLSLVCPPVLPLLPFLSLFAFRRSVSRRPNKPLMRNGCYSCPPRYFCAITIYHICLSTVHPHASFLSLLFLLLPLFLRLSWRRRKKKKRWRPLTQRCFDVSGTPCRLQTFRPNHPPPITSGAVRAP